MIQKAVCIYIYGLIYILIFHGLFSFISSYNINKHIRSIMIQQTENRMAQYTITQIAVYFWMNYISHPCVFLNLSHFETFCLSPYTFLPVLPCSLKEAFGVDWAPLKMATQDQGVSPREQHPPVRPAPIDKAVGNPAARKRKKTTLVCRRCGAPWSRRRSSSPTEWRRAGWTTCPRCKSRSAETAAMARTVTRDCSYACVRACVWRFTLHLRRCWDCALKRTM